jgi:DNA-binding transcriptional ArsR family regulator
VRRKVLALLKAGPMSAGELAEHFDLTRPTLSVHFAKLREADLVAVERQGTSLIYHLNTSVLEQALADVLSLREEK